MAREESHQEKVEGLEIKAEVDQAKEEEIVEEILNEAEKGEAKPVEAPKEVKPEKKVIAPEGWKPKTILGKKVLSGEITDIATVFSEGMKISEPIIVDILLPKLDKETILIGGSTGKGGGIKRTPFKRSSRMHKSGRRYKISVMTVIGNRNGYVGVGLASGPAGKNQEVMQKALNKAKLSLIPIRRGCGSWECLCGTNHSIPFSVLGKSGSVRMTLLPAPRGIGLAVSDEVKKILKLAGISDIWSKSKGNSQMRANLIRCVFNALKKLNAYKVKPEFEKESGMSAGRVD
jgi:small subunit ribosomal protein S5